jgi:hypothetical protein
VYKWYCVQCCMQHCTQYHLYTGKCILTGSTEQRYFKVDGSVEKKWDTVIPADLKVFFVSVTYTVFPSVHERVNLNTVLFIFKN